MKKDDNLIIKNYQQKYDRIIVFFFHGKDEEVQNLFTEYFISDRFKQIQLRIVFDCETDEKYAGTKKGDIFFFF